MATQEDKHILRISDTRASLSGGGASKILKNNQIAIEENDGFYRLSFRDNSDDTDNTSGEYHTVANLDEEHDVTVGKMPYATSLTGWGDTPLKIGGSGARVGIGGDPDSTELLKITGNTIMYGETRMNKINDVGPGGTSGSPLDVDVAGYNVIRITATASPQYYDLKDGSDGQILLVTVTGIYGAYVVNDYGGYVLISESMLVLFWWDNSVSKWKPLIGS